MNATPRQNLYQLIKGFKTAMLVTRARQQAMHARPLAVADVPEDGDILFATSSRSPKVAEIAADPRVLVTFQGKGDPRSGSHRTAVVGELAALVPGRCR